jgi:hypothetical protein
LILPWKPCKNIKKLHGNEVHKRKRKLKRRVELESSKGIDRHDQKGTLVGQRQGSQSRTKKQIHE